MSEQRIIEYSKKSLPPSFAKVGWGLTIAGLLLVAGVYAVDQTRALFNNIIGLSLLVSIAVGATFYVALEYLAGAIWSTPFRRVMEFLSAATPLVVLLALPLFFHLPEVYHWASKEKAAADALLASKSPYLNVQFFSIRFIVYVVLWLAFSLVFMRNSKKQDVTKDPLLTKRNIRWSTVFMPVFGVTMTFFSIDWIMSIEAHWYSTIFGVYFFIGSVIAALAIATFIIVTMNEAGLFVKGLGADHYYSLGALLFAFINFWAYIAFSQFMLIWYANVPEETFWFMARWKNGWEYVSVALIFCKFIVPYAVLLSQPSKKDPNRLKYVSLWIVASHVADLYWLVMPSYSASVVLSWKELGFPLLVIGLFILVFAWKYRGNNLVPIGDPKLERGIKFRL